jgi:hypothetical protein
MRNSCTSQTRRDSGVGLRGRLVLAKLLLLLLLQLLHL